MGELTPEEIVQPDWYKHIYAARLLGMSVTELLALPDFDYEYWVTRAIQSRTAEDEAKGLIDFAQNRSR